MFLKLLQKVLSERLANLEGIRNNGMDTKHERLTASVLVIVFARRGEIPPKSQSIIKTVLVGLLWNAFVSGKLIFIVLLHLHTLSRLCQSLLCLPRKFNKV